MDVPGVPRELQKDLALSRIWMIEGTSDAIQDAWRHALCIKYAEEYNKVILDRAKGKERDGS